MSSYGHYMQRNNEPNGPSYNDLFGKAGKKATALNLKKKATEQDWIGIDLDGSLAEYTEWKGIEHIGKPIQKIVDRVKKWIEEGKIVKIFTARASEEGAEKYIHEWLEEQGLPKLEITNKKDRYMLEYWDDRAIQLIPNTGERADGKNE